MPRQNVKTRRSKSRSSYSRYRSFSKSQKNQIIKLARTKGGEKKRLDTDISVAAITNTVTTNGDHFIINEVAAGDRYINRDGLNIFSKQLRIRGNLNIVAEINSGAFVSANVVRMVVLYHKHPQAVMPEFQEIFGGSDGTTTYSTQYSSLKLDEANRYITLLDKLYYIQTKCNYIDELDTITAAIPVDEYLDLSKRNLKTTFTSATPGSLADFSEGAISVWFRAEYSTANQVTSAFSGYAEYTFTD